MSFPCTIGVAEIGGVGHFGVKVRERKSEFTSRNSTFASFVN